jgi:sugar/nucleoside kinase (ribokinase family)
VTLPLLALSNVIVDRIRGPNGCERKPMVGGAGLYAATAIAIWWPRTALVAGVGRNFEAVTDGIAVAYGFDRRGLAVKDESCIESILTYAADGSRVEAQTAGPDHFSRMQLTTDDIDPALLPAAGCYIFRNGDQEFWEAYSRNRDRMGIVLWEISDKLTRTGDRARVAQIASGVDVVSLNLEEARELLGDASPIDLLDGIQALGSKVSILRMGADGALIADHHQRLHVRPPPHAVVDVTGGGNAFSGGFLAGLCRTPGDLRSAARAAAASAACAIAQFGPAFPPSPELMAALAEATRVEDLVETIG